MTLRSRDDATEAIEPVLPILNSAVKQNGVVFKGNEALLGVLGISGKIILEIRDN